MKRFILSTFICVSGILIGILAGVIIHSSFMLVENKGCLMLPDVEPEQKVLVMLASGPFGAKDYEKGDIIAYMPETYALDGEGLVAFRRVVGRADEEDVSDSGAGKVYGYSGSKEYLKLSCDVSLVDDESLIISKEDILGRAIIY